MAASLVTALPVVIMYALSERFIKEWFDRRWREGLKRRISLQRVLNEKVMQPQHRVLLRWLI